MASPTQNSLFAELDIEAPAQQTSCKSDTQSTSSAREYAKTPVPVKRDQGRSKTPALPKPIQHKSTLPARYLTDQDVAQYFAVSRATIWRWAKERANFPKPLQLSPGTSRWRLEDLQAFEMSLGRATK